MGSRAFAKHNDTYDIILNFGYLGMSNGTLFAYTLNNSVNDMDFDRIDVLNEKSPESPLDAFSNGVKIHLADHSGVFKGNVGTHHDVLESVAHLCDNVKAIVGMLLQLTSETAVTETAQYQCETYDKVFDCLANNLQCEYFNNSIGEIKGRSNAYSSVYRTSRVTPRTAAIYEYLNMVMGRSDCGDGCTEYVNGTVSLVGTHGADIDVEDYKVVGNSGDAWTESDWRMMRLRLYSLRPIWYDIVVGVCVVVITTLIAAAIYIIHKKRLLVES